MISPEPNAFVSPVKDITVQRHPLIKFENKLNDCKGLSSNHQLESNGIRRKKVEKRKFSRYYRAIFTSAMESGMQSNMAATSTVYRPQRAPS